MILKDNESQMYSGGGKVALIIGGVIISVGSFILGFIDGYSNPKKCKSK